MGINWARHYTNHDGDIMGTYWDISINDLCWAIDQYNPLVTNTHGVTMGLHGFDCGVQCKYGMDISINRWEIQL